ncbi:MAG: protein kinase [Myxococcota bacterium]|nr:protein kinase [Myxococcota bacterium]
MNPTIDILRAELERLFSLEEMTSMSARLLGLDPHDVGGATAKASFAKALTERCVDGDRLDALVDVILATRPGVDPRVRDTAGLLGQEGVPPGGRVGPFAIGRRLGEGELSVVYAATRDEEERVVKVLRRAAARDRGAVQRFLTATRMMSAVGHRGLPKGIEAGESAGQIWVSYLQRGTDTQPLSARFARSGPARIEELKPILIGILEPLAALHKARMVHGALKMENVLVARGTAAKEGAPAGDESQVTVVDLGTDRLRYQATAGNGHSSVLAVYGSPKTIAPEQVRGQRADFASDVYAFGAMLYELLSGTPVFPFETATDAAFAHVTRVPEPPSAKAPQGWIGKDVDDFILALLAKAPEKRPKNASALLDALDWLARGTTSRGAGAAFPEERLTELIDRLVSAPDDADAAIGLEQAVDQGADATRVADAFEVAAGAVQAEAADGLDVKKSLLFRAARIFEVSLNDKKGAERVYEAIVHCDPTDDIARTALDEVRKSLGKYAEVVESLMSRSEEAAHGEERARLFAEIGRLCASELDDPEQGVLAYARALCETPSVREYADEIERLASSQLQLWSDVLSSLTESARGDSLSSTAQNELLAHAGRWYDEKVGRADLGLLAYKQILEGDPANEEAHEGLASIYKKAQQWPELVGVLVTRANAFGGLPRARDLRAEAGEVYEQKLNDAARAKEMYARVLAEEPGHAKAADGMVRIAQRTGDFDALVAILERRAESRRGQEKVDTLLKLARVYEDDIEDLTEATRHYRAVLEMEPHELQALKGLERIYGRTGKYSELLANLELQVTIAATPRQKVNIYERLAILHDEEFLDHARAADSIECLLAIDSSNDGALTALPRHYRALGEWEQLERLYDRHAAMVTDEARRVDLMMQRARVLAENIGSPDRATRVYEDVLAIQPSHSGALEALARLRELAGDANAALAAIEALAAQAPTPEARAELCVRAARLLEGHGDRDGAIERYKLALEASPRDAAAGAALRQAYAARGEASSVVALVERELDLADSKMQKARLYAELARVQREKLRDDVAAEANARTAIDLDPTNGDALLVLGDIAFEQRRYVEANKHLEQLVGGASSLPTPDAIRLLTRFVETYGHTVAARAPAPDKTRDSAPPPSRSIVREHPRLAAAVETLEQIAPNDAEALLRVGRVLLECGDAVAARRT